jgi:hypothetical protein
MAADFKLPVYVRVGDHPEAHFGDVTIGLTDGLLDEAAYRKEMAAFLRAAADAIENPSEDDEEPT